MPVFATLLTLASFGHSFVDGRLAPGVAVVLQLIAQELVVTKFISSLKPTLELRLGILGARMAAKARSQAPCLLDSVR